MFVRWWRIPQSWAKYWLSWACQKHCAICFSQLNATTTGRVYMGIVNNFPLHNTLYSSLSIDWRMFLHFYYMHTHIHTPPHICTCTHACMRMHAHTHMHTYMHTYMHAHMHARMHARMHTHTHACTHTHRVNIVWSSVCNPLWYQPAASLGFFLSGVSSWITLKLTLLSSRKRSSVQSLDRLGHPGGGGVGGWGTILQRC